MATLYQGQALKTIIKELEKREFRVSFEVLNSSLFGVPQVRERLFIIAKKGKDKPYLPKSLMSKDSLISCSMAISDLPSLEHSKGEEFMIIRKNTIIIINILCEKDQRASIIM